MWEAYDSNGQAKAKFFCKALAEAVARRFGGYILRVAEEW